MTLVFERKTGGPGTHALIVASGDVRRYRDAASDAPAVSGHLVARWLIDRFRNPDAPLASVELLAAGRDSPFDSYRPSPAGPAVRLDPPTSASLKDALAGWRGRLDSSFGNIAFFYYAGFVFRRPETLLPLSDFAEDVGAGVVAIPALLAMMRGCRAGRHLYVVDGIPKRPGSAVKAMRPAPLEAPPPLKHRGWAVIEAATPDANHAGPSFASIFLDALQPKPPATRVSVMDLVRNLKEKAARADKKAPGSAVRVTSSAIEGNFDLHYPDPAPPRDSGGEAGRSDAPPSIASAAAGPESVRSRSIRSRRERFSQLVATAFPGRRRAAGAALLGVGERTLRGWVEGIHYPRDFARYLKRIGLDRSTLDLPDEQWSELLSAIPGRVAELDRRESGPGPPPTAAAEEQATDFIADDAETERDELGRSVLAIGLARRLHKIWRGTNVGTAADREGRAAFVVHLDAPWGGGKTSFANFVARVLNPGHGEPAHFLAERYSGADLGGIFLDDPPPDAAAAAALAKLPADARRPWIVVSFNAWQAEHCAPPWWVFYQAIRKGCFRAIRTEGDAPWMPRPPPAGASPFRRARRWRAFRAGAQGKLRWLYLAVREYLWRLRNPKILSVMLLAAIGSLALVVLAWREVLDWTQLRTWIPVLSAALAGLWGLAAFFTESVAPGDANVAERLSLGAGDPFARFRIHFARMMERVRRPVLVVVDDLDRCRPEFVVDLIRGIQTLLRSPRVVFVILGDRDWIERAFESHHAGMSKVDVGPEQTFGARFVEKAIQMSFILPALGPDRQLGYVRRVLLGERAAAGARPPAHDPAEEARRHQAGQEAEAALRAFVNEAAAEPETSSFESAPLVERVYEEFYRIPGPDEPIGIGEIVSARFEPDRVDQLVRETLAVRVASDEKAEREIVHELQRFASFFPSNPRQIKRIVNAVTIYHSVAIALQRPGLIPDENFRAQLALWVIIMTEWPQTWRLLAAFPDLVDIVRLEPAPAEAAMRAPGIRLPGSVRATVKALERIRADAELMTLITGRGEPGHAALETRYARTLAALTPLHSRKPRLAEEHGATEAEAPAPAAPPAVSEAAERKPPSPRKPSPTAAR